MQFSKIKISWLQPIFNNIFLYHRVSNLILPELKSSSFLSSDSSETQHRKKLKGMKDFIEFSLPSFIRILPAVVIENLQILETVRTMLRFWLDYLFNLNKLFNISVFQFL